MNFFSNTNFNSTTRKEPFQFLSAMSNSGFLMKLKTVAYNSTIQEPVDENITKYETSISITYRNILKVNF